MKGLSIRSRTILAAALVLLMSLTIPIESFRADSEANRVRQGTEVVAALASVVATLSIIVKETSSFLNGVAPLISSLDRQACARGLTARESHAAVVGAIRQVFIVREDRAVCQSSPGAFSVLDDTGKRLRWAVAPSMAAPLSSGEPILGAISGEWVVVVAKHDRERRGMVVASLSLSAVNALAFDGLPATTLITVTDAQGRTLLRSEAFADRVGRIIPLQPSVEGVSQSRFGFPLLRRPDGTVTVTQSEPVISPDAQGVTRVWTGRDLSPLPWVAFAGQPLVTPSIANLIEKSALPLAPTLILVILTLWLLSSLSRELRALGAYVAQVAEADNMLPPRRFAAEFAPVVTAFRLAFDLRKSAELQLERTNEVLAMRVDARVAELRRTEAFRDAVMETAHDALVVVDARGVIVAVNSGVEQVLGRKKEDMLGNRLADLIVPRQYLQAHHNAFSRRMAGTDDLRGRRVELPVMRADGTTFPAEIVISTTRFSDQVFAVGFIRDITERVRAERELRDAVTAASAAARAKSEFLATMSHEIRTPLNGIMGMLDLLIDSPSDTSRTKHLTIARRSADGLLQLLNDILDYSRLDAGRLELVSEDFDLHLLIAEVSGLVGDIAASKGLQVHHHIAPGVPRMCCADRARLRQVLFNLASNAVKFTASGEVTISATMTTSVSAAVEIRLAVADTGPGIAAGRLQEIFEPFTQADSSMARRFGGSGLGLAIVKALVARMGGTVGVTSEHGRGSTFFVDITLPNASAPRRADAQVTRSAALRASVLIVEDDPASQFVAKEALTRAGHSCDVAADGPTSLAMAASTRYDAILMDYRLPGMDGAEATRRLRQAGFQGPIIAVTAETSAEDRHACLDAGVSAILSKPVAARQLVDALQSALADRRSPL